MTEVYDVSEDAEDHPTAFLGNEAKDKVTGFTGIITSVMKYPNGNLMMGIQPRIKEGEDKVQDALYFDHNIIEILGPGLSELVVEPEIEAFDIGDTVDHVNTEFKGTVTTITWYMSGCAQYTVTAPRVNKESGLPVTSSFLTEMLKKTGENSTLKETVQKKTGGPNLKVQRQL